MSPIMFKKYLKINLLEMTGCILYFIAWTRKFAIDPNYVYVLHENDDYRYITILSQGYRA